MWPLVNDPTTESSVEINEMNRCPARIRSFLLQSQTQNVIHEVCCKSSSVVECKHTFAMYSYSENLILIESSNDIS